ncbi:hypothetical protein [Saccharothrix luteola]|uniref:hypothetical protein n=1 Tax=Saccharothrix luteola TaxID=2893018 RepID=UPI001E57031F|nr:hypothetical protein [Saccharothrix luteola]MCC8250220.1 hypothetical protein [Saccharothrix luteola]
MSTPEPGPFQPYISVHDTPSTDAGWNRHPVKGSLHRIRHSRTVEDAHAQATTEAVVLLHSIRRLLLWIAVLLAILVALVIVPRIVILFS